MSETDPRSEASAKTAAKSSMTATRAMPRASAGATSSESTSLAEPAGATSNSSKKTAPAPIVISGGKKAATGAATVARKARLRGPRSRTARLTLWTVAGVALLAVLLGASPLGKAGPFGGTFEAYAQAVPWSAPPTPTPKPKPAPVGRQAIIDKINAVFGVYAPGALNIARCESDYDPNAWNSIAIGNSHASGVFQILYPSTWNGTSYAHSSPYDADANIRAAHEIFVRDGYSWREWACKP